MSDEKQTDEMVSFSAVFTREENDLVEQFASLLGICKSTAIKMHLRQTLPAKIAELKGKVKEKT